MDDERDQDRAADAAPPERSIRIVDADQVRFIYANSAIIRTSPWDIMLDFGLIQEATKEELVVQHQVRVAMSLQHAKEMARIFNQRIQQYEEIYGQIPGPQPTEGRGEG